MPIYLPELIQQTIRAILADGAPWLFPPFARRAPSRKRGFSDPMLILL